MNKYYTSAFKDVLGYIKHSLEAINSAKQLLREGKAFDVMDKINLAETFMMRLISKSDIVYNNLEKDFEESKEMMELLIGTLSYYTPEWVDLTWMNYHELIDMWFYYAKFSHLDPYEIDKDELYGQFQRGEFMNFLKNCHVNYEVIKIDGTNYIKPKQ